MWVKHCHKPPMTVNDLYIYIHYLFISMVMTGGWFMKLRYTTFWWYFGDLLFLFWLGLPHLRGWFYTPLPLTPLMNDAANFTKFTKSPQTSPTFAKVSVSFRSCRVARRITSSFAMFDFSCLSHPLMRLHRLWSTAIRITHGVVPACPHIPICGFPHGISTKTQQASPCGRGSGRYSPVASRWQCVRKRPRKPLKVTTPGIFSWTSSQKATR